MLSLDWQFSIWVFLALGKLAHGLHGVFVMEETHPTYEWAWICRLSSKPALS